MAGRFVTEQNWKGNRLYADSWQRSHGGKQEKSGRTDLIDSTDDRTEADYADSS